MCFYVKVKYEIVFNKSVLLFLEKHYLRLKFDIILYTSVSLVSAMKKLS